MIPFCKNWLGMCSIAKASKFNHFHYIVFTFYRYFVFDYKDVTSRTINDKGKYSWNVLLMIPIFDDTFPSSIMIDGEMADIRNNIRETSRVSSTLKILL